MARKTTLGEVECAACGEPIDDGLCPNCDAFEWFDRAMDEEARTGGGEEARP